MNQVSTLTTRLSCPSSSMTFSCKMPTSYLLYFLALYLAGPPITDFRQSFHFIANSKHEATILWQIMRGHEVVGPALSTSCIGQIEIVATPAAPQKVPFATTSTLVSSSTYQPYVTHRGWKLEIIQNSI